MVVDEDTNVPEAQGRLLGMPYELRKPTIKRLKARFWNPEDERVLTPMAFGWGYAVNLRIACSKVAALLRQ
jgi:hypothetical protein|nr:MAG: hypothetical protein J07AB56_01330 [Candidatus Nanosalinarum sp. J07AB56]